MNEIECVLGRNCGLTFAGLKPSSLFTVKKSLYGQIGRYRTAFGKKGFYFLEAGERGERILLFVYHDERLEKILTDGENKEFLLSCGYGYGTADEAVNELIRRLRGENFPHEVGIFLGYPLSDVKAFISHPNEGVRAVGCWKAYSDKQSAEKTFARFRRCSERIMGKLIGGEPLAAIFRTE